MVAVAKYANNASGEYAGAASWHVDTRAAWALTATKRRGDTMWATVQ